MDGWGGGYGTYSRVFSSCAVQVYRDDFRTSYTKIRKKRSREKPNMHILYYKRDPWEIGIIQLFVQQCIACYTFVGAHSVLGHIWEPCYISIIICFFEFHRRIILYISVYIKYIYIFSLFKFKFVFHPPPPAMLVTLRVNTSCGGLSRTRHQNYKCGTPTRIIWKPCIFILCTYLPPLWCGLCLVNIIT